MAQPSRENTFDPYVMPMKIQNYLSYYGNDDCEYESFKCSSDQMKESSQVPSHQNQSTTGGGDEYNYRVYNAKADNNINQVNANNYNSIQHDQSQTQRARIVPKNLSTSYNTP